MDNVAEKLDNINRTLEKHNAITQKMLELMQKPENPFFKALTIAGIGVGILGIIQVIDTRVLGGRYDFTTHSGYSFNYSRNFYCDDSLADEALLKTVNL